MKKLLEEKRENCLQAAAGMGPVLTKTINDAFNEIEDEAEAFANMLEHDATLIERVAVKLPHTGKMMGQFGDSLRDYAGRIREGRLRSAGRNALRPPDPDSQVTSGLCPTTPPESNGNIILLPGKDGA